MRIAQMLHQAYHQEDPAFIRALYRQLLNRSPDDREAARCLQALADGCLKHELIVGLTQSEEAQDLYNRPPRNWPETVADKLQFIGHMEKPMIVAMLYAEVLCRSVDNGGYETHLNHLYHGGTFLDLIRVFLTCEELLLLLQSDMSTIEFNIR